MHLNIRRIESRRTEMKRRGLHEHDEEKKEILIERTFDANQNRRNHKIQIIESYI